MGYFEHSICQRIKCPYLINDTGGLYCRHGYPCKYDEKVNLWQRLKEAESDINMLINFIPNGWPMPLGWSVLVAQVKKRRERLL